MTRIPVLKAARTTLCLAFAGALTSAEAIAGDQPFSLDFLSARSERGIPTKDEWSVAVLGNGHVVATSTSADLLEARIVERAPDGRILWARHLPRSAVSPPNAVPFEGGFLVGILTRGTHLAYFGPDGNVNWIRSFGTPEGLLRGAFVALVVDDARDEIYLAGVVWPSPPSGSSNAYSQPSTENFVAKLNAMGDVQWSKRLEAASPSMELRSAALAPQNGVYLSTQDYLLKLDSAGNLIWANQLSFENWALPLWTLSPAPNGITITGTIGVFAAANGLAARVDADGQILWAKGVDVSPNDALFSGAGTQDGEVLMVGSVEPEEIGRRSDGWIVKLGEGGRVEWSLTLADKNESHFESIAIGKEGLAAMGTMETLDAGRQPILMTLPHNGAVGKCALIQAAEAAVVDLLLKAEPVELAVEDYPILATAADLPFEPLEMTADPVCD